MDTRMERINAALAVLDGWTARQVSEACAGFVSERTVLYLRSGREMKRPPNRSTVAALERAAKAKAQGAAA